MMDDFAELTDLNREINDALANPSSLGVDDIDEDDLEAELADLFEEEEEITTSSRGRREDLKFPEVPAHKPSKKRSGKARRDAEEDELAELDKWVAS
jgi:hypothetical protein